MLRSHRLLGCAILLLCAKSVAAPDDRADQLFRQGRQAYMRGDFQTAAQDQAEAWQLRKSFDIAANLGQAELKLELYRDAAEHLRYALDHFPASLSDHAKKRLLETLNAARAQVAELTLEVTPSGAQIFVDKKPAGQAPLSEPLYLAPGMHEVRAELHGYRTEQRAFAVRAGQTQALTLTLGAAPATALTAAPAGSAGMSQPAATSRAAPQAPPSAGQEQGAVAPRTVALISGAGLTAVSLGVGIGFAVKASSANSDAQNTLKSLQAKYGSATPCDTAPASECQPLTNALNDRDSANQVARIAFVASGVFAAATVATFFFWPRRTRSSETALQLVPVTGPGATGIWMRGSF